MTTVTIPNDRPLYALRKAVRPSWSGVRLVEDANGSTFIEARFDHAPNDLLELLCMLDDIGWAPVPEENDCAELSADGNGSRIRVRRETEMRIDEY
jgi:hypothetical protein